MSDEQLTFKGREVPPLDHVGDVEDMARELARDAFYVAARVERYGTPQTKANPVYAYREGVISLPKFQITVTVAIHRPIVITEHVTQNYAPYEENET